MWGTSINSFGGGGAVRGLLIFCLFCCRVSLENLTLEVLEREILTALTLGDFEGGPLEIQVSYDLILAGPGGGAEDEEVYSLFR